VTDAPPETDPTAGPPPTGSAEPLLDLRVMDEALLAAVAALAVAEAEPSDVMPVPPGTRRWTPELSRAFVDHHRDRLPGLEGARAASSPYPSCRCHLPSAARSPRR
jgi:hypothetical protein